MDEKLVRIESWQGVADYLHCDIKTAMRWEKERGLPIHRYPGNKRSGVFAFRHELDEWLRRKPTHGVAQNTGADQTATQPEVALGPQGSKPGSSTTAPAPTGGTSPSRRGRRAAVSGLVLVGVLGLIALATSGSHRRDPPVSLRAESATLAALDGGGRTLWTHAFGAAFPETTPRQKLGDRSWIGDLDGDGRPEVLFVAAQPVGDGAIEDTLHCFDAGGKELWSFRLNDTIRFRTRDFGPPWYLGSLAVYEVGSQKRIALSLAHSTWWPAALLTFDAQGKRLTTFVSSGLIYRLRTTMREGRPLILAAGVSNSRSAAGLIVLDGENPVGATFEEPGSPYECLSCPVGHPLRYFSFPKSELTRAAKLPYNSGQDIRASASKVVVEVRELPTTPDGSVTGLLTYFRFDSSFRLTDARFSDSFLSDHEVFEERGVLNHSAAACPNQVPQVQVYLPGEGLVDLPLLVPNHDF